MNNKRKYQKGDLGGQEVIIYGKPYDYETIIDNLVNQVITNIDEQLDPISGQLKNSNNSYPNKALREVKDKLKVLVEPQKSRLRDIVNEAFADLVDSQEELIYTFRKLNVVNEKLDGYIDTNNGAVTFDLSGDTFFADSSNPQSLQHVISLEVPKYLTKINSFMADRLLDSPSEFSTQTYTILNATSADQFNNSPATNRFYVCNSTIFLNEGQYQGFVDGLVNLEEVKKIPNMVDQIKTICAELKDTFKKVYDSEVKGFNDSKSDPTYVSLTTLTLPIIPGKVGYVSPAPNDVQVKQQKLKDLYANQNLNTTDSFDGKVTLN